MLKNPLHRVKTESGTSRVRVEIGGRVVADTTRPVMVHETGLPVRYYLPPEDVATDLLEPAATRTHCPYKGDAVYWSYRGGDGEPLPDAVWAYPEPLPAVAAICGHLSFYDSVADITVDGVPVAGPRAD